MQCAAGPRPQAWRPGRPARGLGLRCQGGELQGPTAAPASAALPYVSWNRYHQQLLFVDRSDTVRGRFAVGMLERIADWNGHGRMMVGLQCGLDAQDGSSIDVATAAGLMALASAWRMRPRLWASPRQAFEPEDIDRFDLIIALDASIQAEVLAQLAAARPAAPVANYACRVCCLTDFVLYAQREALLKEGGTGLLDRQLRFIMRNHLGALRAPAPPAEGPSGAAQGGLNAGGGDAGEVARVKGSGELANNAVALPAHLLPSSIPRPSLQGAGDGDWEAMIALLALCCAGLLSYLIDQYPSDLPDYDPL